MDMFDITQDELSEAIKTLKRIKYNIENKPKLYMPISDLFNVMTLDNVIGLLNNSLEKPEVKDTDFRITDFRMSYIDGEYVMSCKGCNCAINDDPPLLASVDGILYPFCEKCHSEYVVELEIDEDE